MDRTSFPHNEHSQNSRSNTEVYGNHQKTHMKRSFATEDAIFGDQEYDSSKTAGNGRSNKPGSHDLRHTFIFPSPSYCVRADESNTGANDSADDAMSTNS